MQWIYDSNFYCRVGVLHVSCLGPGYGGSLYLFSSLLRYPEGEGVHDESLRFSAVYLYSILVVQSRSTRKSGILLFSIRRIYFNQFSQ